MSWCKVARSLGTTVQGGFGHPVAGWFFTCHCPGWLWSTSATAGPRLKAHPRVTAQGGLATQCHSMRQAQDSQCQQSRMASVTCCHGTLQADGSPSVTAHPHLAAPLVSWCRVLGVTALREAVTKCRGVHPVSLPGADVVPWCHDMEWLCALVVPQCHGLGGFSPLVSLPIQVTVRGGSVSTVTTCPHCHGPAGARLARGSCLLPPGRIPRPPGPGRAADGAAEDARSLPPPASSRGVTGAGLGPGPGMGSERYRARCGSDRAGPGPDEPNRTESSAAGPRESQWCRTETS